MMLIKIVYSLVFNNERHSRDYYNLQLIQETCGDFPKSFLKKTSHYKQFFDKNYKLKGYEKFAKSCLTILLENIVAKAGALEEF